MLVMGKRHYPIMTALVKQLLCFTLAQKSYERRNVKAATMLARIKIIPANVKGTSY